MGDINRTQRRPTRKPAAMVAGALFLLMLALGALTPNVSAATKTVTVCVEHIKALDPVDSSGEADFYIWTTLQGYTPQKSDEPILANDDDIWPYWHFVFSNVPSGSGQSYSVKIEIWDDDGGSGDDLCDAARYGGTSSSSKTIDLTYYIDTGMWTNDDDSREAYDPDGWPGHTSGGEDGSENPDTDEDDCEVEFYITAR